MQPTDGVRMVHAVLNERKQLLLKTENAKEVVFVQKLLRCSLLYCTVPLHYESLLYSSILYATGLFFLMSFKICSKETYLLRRISRKTCLVLHI